MMRELVFSKKKKSNPLIIAIVAIVTCAVLVFAFFFVRHNRGGVVVQAKRDYPVNENIQSYRQDNPIWGDDKIGKSSFTLASSGCVITCISSMLSLTDNVMNPQELNSYLTEHGVFDDEGNLQWGILDSIEGFHAEVFNEVSSDIIDKCLAEGKLPIIKVHQNNLMSYHHFILVIGAEDGEYICMDPLQDHLTKLSEYKNKVFSIRCVSYNG